MKITLISKYTNLALALCIGLGAYAQTSYIIPDGKSEDAGYLHFRENLGQVLSDSLDSVPDIKFYCTQMESKMWIQKNGIISWTNLKEGIDTLPDTTYRIDMQPYLEGTPIVSDNPVAEESTGATSNYYLPHCGANGIENVGHYQRITQPSIYPNIHQQLYSNSTGFKYYYIIEPGGDPDDINIVFSGQDQISVTPTKMDFYIGQVQLTLDNAIAYEINSSNQVVPLSWTPTFSDQGSGSITFGTGTYNTNNTLVIQIGAPSFSAAAGSHPTSMEYSSYLTADKNDNNIKTLTNSTGDIFILGESTSSKFPSLKGKKVNLYNSKKDVILFKFNSNMEPKKYTFYGTNNGDNAKSMVIDNSGNVLVVGNTPGASLPKSSNTKPGVVPYSSGYIAKLDGNLKLTSSYWFGTDGATSINDIGIGSNNKIIIVGKALNLSVNLPVANLGGLAYYQSVSHSAVGGTDGFIASLSPSFAIEHCTWYGDDAENGFHKLSIDNAGNIYALMSTGKPTNRPPNLTCAVQANKSMPKCFVFNSPFIEDDRGSDDYYLAEFNSNLRLIWGTWIGSTKGEGEAEMDLVVDKANPTILYLALSTDNPVTFPKSTATSGYIVNRTTDGNRNVMILKFVGGVLTWHTSLGCTGNQTSGLSIEMDDKQNVFVAGVTKCRDIPLPGGWCKVPGLSKIFPMCANGTDLFVQSNQYIDGQNNPSVLGFITTFDKNNNLKWSTWFGGNGTDRIQSLHFNATQERMYAVGQTFSSGVPIPLQKLPIFGSHYQSTLASSQGGMVAWFDSDLNFVSVQEIESNNWSLKAYPNPTSSWLHIEMEGSANYKLYDITGRLLQSGILSPEVNAIEVQSLSTGSYVLRLEQDGKAAAVKFIKE